MAKEDIDFNNLKGSWEIYRRNAEPGFITDNTVLIKSLSIISTTENNMAAGEIVIYTNEKPLQTIACKMAFSGGMLHIEAPGFSAVYVVYKADGNELIFGKEEGIINYAKK